MVLLLVPAKLPKKVPSRLAVPLTDTYIKNLKPTSDGKGKKYSDGGGLYLLVKPGGKYWRLNYRTVGKQKTLALGVYPEVSLAKARQRREKARQQLADGLDPSTAKQEERRAHIVAASNTFEVVARDWLTKTKAKRAAITQLKITRSLVKDVFPFIVNMAMSTIGLRDVLEKVVRRIEARGAIETAHRVKQNIGQIFRYAVVSELADRDVTSDLKEALSSKPDVKHHAAITEPRELGALLRATHAYSGHFTTVAALKLAPLCLVRPVELRTMEWAELRLEEATWQIPSEKMKMNADHIVPLPSQAVDILRELKPITGHGRYIFPSIRTGERPMSENTVNAALRSLGFDGTVQTGHGFRATARTILDEVLGERVDFIEHQLAHAVKDPNGRAYNRTAHLPARRKMMQRWADYLDKLRLEEPSGK